MTAPDASVLALAEQLHDEWESCVDELEASVLLEVGGVNEAAAVARFGVTGVAELARTLVAMVPARADPPGEPPPLVDRPSTAQLVGRGVLFAAPGPFYLVFAHTGPSRASAYAALIAVLVGWGLSQGVAAVAYRMLGRVDPSSAAIVQFRTTSAVLVAAAVGGGLALVVGVDHDAVLLAAAQVVYMMAGGVLLFYRADRVLACTLVPGVLASALFLFHRGFSAPVTLAAVGASILATAACALGTTLRHTDRRLRAPLLLPRRDLLAALPFVVQGVVTGGVVAAVPIAMLTSAHGPHGHALGLMIAPLVLSMGFAELELWGLYRRGRLLLHRSHSIAAYARSAVRTALVGTARYVAVLAVLSTAAGLVLWATAGVTTPDLLMLCSYTVLGAAVLQVLILGAFGRVWLSLAGYAAAFALTAAVLTGLHLCGVRPGLEHTYLLLCVTAAAVMTVLAGRALRNPIVFA